MVSGGDDGGDDGGGEVAMLLAMVAAEAALPQLRETYAAVSMCTCGVEFEGRAAGVGVRGPRERIRTVTRPEARPTVYRTM